MSLEDKITSSKIILRDQNHPRKAVEGHAGFTGTVAQLQTQVRAYFEEHPTRNHIPSEIKPVMWLGESGSSAITTQSGAATGTERSAVPSVISCVDPSPQRPLALFSDVTAHASRATEGDGSAVKKFFGSTKLRLFVDYVSTILRNNLPLKANSGNLSASQPGNHFSHHNNSSNR